MMNPHNSNHVPPTAPEPGASPPSDDLSGEHEALLARLERILANSSDDQRSTLV